MFLDDVEDAFCSEIENRDAVSFDDLSIEAVVWDIYDEKERVVVISIDGYDFETHIMETETSQYSVEALANENMDVLECLVEEREQIADSLFEY